jgi:hypothetical protein
MENLLTSKQLVENLCRKTIQVTEYILRHISRRVIVYHQSIDRKYIKKNLKLFLCLVKYHTIMAYGGVEI